MGTATKHPVLDRVKPSFVIVTSGHSDAQPWLNNTENYIHTGQILKYAVQCSPNFLYVAVFVVET